MFEKLDFSRSPTIWGGTRNDKHPKKWTTIEMNLEARNQNAGQITE